MIDPALETLRDRAIKEPLGVDISDHSDEWCAGFLAGQVNACHYIEHINEMAATAYAAFFGDWSES